MHTQRKLPKLFCNTMLTYSYNKIVVFYKIQLKTFILVNNLLNYNSSLFN